jgi:hypothetical protein
MALNSAIDNERVQTPSRIHIMVKGGKGRENLTSSLNYIYCCMQLCSHVSVDSTKLTLTIPRIAYTTMHFSVLALTLITTLATAQTNQCAGDNSIVGYCETLTYVDRTTSSSNLPTTANCQDTCRGILSDAGDWSVNFVGMEITLDNLIHPPSQCIVLVSDTDT